MSFCTTFILMQDATRSFCSLQLGVFAGYSFPHNMTTGHVTAARRPSRTVPSSRRLLVWPIFGSS